MSSDAEPAPPSAARRPAPLTLWILGSFLSVAAFLTFATHEVIGHALVARLQGAELRKLQVRVLGGYTRYRMVPDSGWTKLVREAGGLGVNLVLGALALALASRFRGGLRLWLHLFGSLALTAAFGYLGVGSLMGSGDAAGIDFPGGPGVRAAVLGPLGLAGAAVVGIGGYRRLLRWLGGPPGARGGERFRFGMVVAAPVLAGVAAVEFGLRLCFLTGQGEPLLAWLGMLAVPAAAVLLPLADRWAPGARPGDEEPVPLGPGAAWGGAVALAAMLAILASGLYRGIEF